MSLPTSRIFVLLNASISMLPPPFSLPGTLLFGFQPFKEHHTGRDCSPGVSPSLQSSPGKKVKWLKNFCCFLFRGLSGSCSGEPLLFGEDFSLFLWQCGTRRIVLGRGTGRYVWVQLWHKPQCPQSPQAATHRAVPSPSAALLGEISSAVLFSREFNAALRQECHVPAANGNEQLLWIGQC